jgi:hypothetical protein
MPAIPRVRNLSAQQRHPRAPAGDDKICRTEAMRRAMRALIENGAAYEAHPASWAPFVVVGEGAAARSRRRIGVKCGHGADALGVSVVPLDSWRTCCSVEVFRVMPGAVVRATRPRAAGADLMRTLAQRPRSAFSHSRGFQLALRQPIAAQLYRLSSVWTKQIRILPKSKWFLACRSMISRT